MRSCADVRQQLRCRVREVRRPLCVLVQMRPERLWCLFFHHDVVQARLLWSCELERRVLSKTRIRAFDIGACVQLDEASSTLMAAVHRRAVRLQLLWVITTAVPREHDVLAKSQMAT